MPKKRLPPKVHEKHGRYFFVDQNKWNPLSKIEDGIHELHRQLATRTGQSPSTLAGIFTEFVGSDDFAELAESTRHQYQYFYFGILNHTFGHLLPTEVEPTHVAQYLQRRKKAGAATCGNRERAALASAFEYALRTGKALSNPCRGMRRNPEKASKVYIESADLSSKMDAAPKHFAQVMQLGYMTGMRAVDLRALKVSDITPEGIWYTESKTKKRVAMAWTQTLRELVREILEARIERMQRPYANKYKSRVTPVHDYLLTNRFGERLSVWGVISNMRRLKAGWQFKAIRAKAQTDAGERDVLGHTGQMRETYTRRRKLVPVR